MPIKGVVNIKGLPENYKSVRERFKDYGIALSNLGKVSDESGPIDSKTSHLIQLAVAAAIRSEGAVHSHSRRALEAGASEEEIYHALIVITSTIGFPTVAAAISWVDDIIYNRVN
jgi:AhpD family alkylhydroperoxidase